MLVLQVVQFVIVELSQEGVLPPQEEYSSQNHLTEKKAEFHLVLKLFKISPFFPYFS